jgi:hypothetical protein
MRQETTTVRQISSPSIYACGRPSVEVPLRRYFLCVGAGLLVLLFVANALLAQRNQRNSSGPHLPVIRIHSMLKLPPAAVIDTSQHMLTPVTTALAENAPSPASFVMPDTPIRDAFAQVIPPPERQVSSGHATKPERNPKPTRKVVKARTSNQPIFIAQHMNFGLFETNW